MGLCGIRGEYKYSRCVREETYRECEVQLQLHVSKAKNPTHGYFCHVSLFALYDVNSASFLASCRNTLRLQPIAHSNPSSRSHCHLQGESLPKARPQDSLPSDMAEIPRPKLNASCGPHIMCASQISLNPFHYQEYTGIPCEWTSGMSLNMLN